MSQRRSNHLSPLTLPPFRLHPSLWFSNLDLVMIHTLVSIQIAAVCWSSKIGFCARCFQTRSDFTAAQTWIIISIGLLGGNSLKTSQCQKQGEGNKIKKQGGQINTATGGRQRGQGLLPFCYGDFSFPCAKMSNNCQHFMLTANSICQNEACPSWPQQPSGLCSQTLKRLFLKGCSLAVNSLHSDRGRLLTCRKKTK